MKKIAFLLVLLAWMGASTAQIERTTVVQHHIVRILNYELDTMAAHVYTDRMALDVSDQAQTVTTRTYDFLTNTVTEEQRTLDDRGYCTNILRKVGHLSNGNYASAGGDMMMGGNVEYTNVISISNSYQNGKISRMYVEDMMFGEYEIVYLYDQIGNVIGHDTIYDGEHHTDYTAKFSRLHDPWLIQDHKTGIDYRYKYTYNNDVKMDQIASVTETYTDPTTRAAVQNVTLYTYDAQNRLVTEQTTSPTNGTTTINYTYDANGNVILKEAKGETTKFEEIIERDSYGSCVLRKIVQNGRVILQIYNDITYSDGTEA